MISIIKSKLIQLKQERKVLTEKLKANEIELRLAQVALEAVRNEKAKQNDS